MNTIAIRLGHFLPAGSERRAGIMNHAAPTGPAAGINHEYAPKTIGYLRWPNFASGKLPGPVLRAQRTFKARSRFFSLVRRET